MQLVRRLRWGMVIGVLCGCVWLTPVVAQTQQGGVSISGVVPGPPPAIAPTIVQPEANRTFSQKNITVAGSCLPGLIVKIFRNDLFAGSAVCQSDKTYSLHIDLAEGKNDLLARQYDPLNQSSPDSAVTTVYYILPAAQPILPGDSSAPGGVAQFELVIGYDVTVQGIFAGKPLHLPLQFAGGTPPYALGIDWGDGTNSVFSRENSQRFNAEHTYEHGGLYTVKVRVSDKNGNQAFLQFVLVVNGRPGSIVTQALFNVVQFGGWWMALVTMSLATGIAGFVGGLLLTRFLTKRGD